MIPLLYRIQEYTHLILDIINFIILLLSTTQQHQPKYLIIQSYHKTSS